MKICGSLFQSLTNNSKGLEMKHPEIPSFAYRLFKWFCKEEIFEELEGDLEESFLRNKEACGLKKARKIYTREVLKMMRPTVISKPKSGPGYQTALIGSYVTISLRNISRHKLFSFINIFSLSVAMSAGLLIIGMISDLLKFDEFHKNKNEIYRVISKPVYLSRELDVQATTPLYLGEEMMHDIPGVQVTNMGRRFGGEATANEKNLFIDGIYVDEHFFDFLSFELLEGEAEVLQNPFQLVLSESFVQKAYDGKNPIGQTVEIEGFGTFQIAGIVADPPQFSHIQFEALASLSTVHVLARQGIISATHDYWENLDRYYNYIYLPENKAKKEVEGWLSKSAPGYYLNPENFQSTFELQPINEIVPGPDISDAIGPRMMHLPVIILSIIAVAILLSAIFNYTNLSMARSLRRAREVGVRKLNGASGKAIFLQFTIEAVILSFFSLVMGILLFSFLRNHFMELIPRADQLVKLELSPKLIGLFSLFALITGLIAGLSPSIFFSRLSSLNALRSGKTLKSLSRVNFRKGLIVAQFTLSIIFVMAVVITYKQYTFSLNKDMGFNKENILNINLFNNNHEIVRSEFLKLPEVSEVSFSSYNLGVGTYHNLLMVDPRNQDSVWVHQIHVNDTYQENMGLELLAGRNFRPAENTHNETSIIVNETFVKAFGLSNAPEALGKMFNVDGESLEIVGVIKDFIYASMEEEIQSFVFRQVENYRFANVRLSSSDMITTLERMESTWEKIDSKNRFKAKFLEEHIAEYYDFLKDFMKIFGFVGFLAISISTLGLFGMALYATQTRMKEIGIRKTFGASERKLMYLLSKEFFKMVVWAILIGSPICIILFDQVILAQHAFRVKISFVDVGVSILLLLTLCFLTVITQTWSAARRNPSSVLRDE